MFFLDIIPIKECYTRANITNTIIDILDKYDIFEKTLALTTDNASSMILCTIVAKELEKVWWQEKQHEYPRLSLIAKDYLCIQTTSVSSEQAFSIAGQTIIASRNRLNSKVARIVLCLKY
ncbi:22274_t:CDS:2 [Gigaspora margarita]|uniref:22274_t:CDS:1 n=1 Tax=Gigaspora margarita TaxID=4874 RepID=A0ABM8W6K5_GIGMA|nr:22274_t:CDS:2 [Gigaspora margarita]